MRKKIVVLLGPPGSGKGTQAVRLAEAIHLPHISTGDLFRENIKAENALGIEAKSYIDKGLLTPDELVTKMVVERTKKEDAAKGFILDGYPRRLSQAKALEKLFPDAEIIVLNLFAHDDVVIDRIAGRLICKACGWVHHQTNYPPKVKGVCDRCGGELYQRPDDKREVVLERLRVYLEETEPLVSYFGDKGILRNISAEAKQDQVLMQLLAFL